MSCDWCMGRAGDLVSGENVFADINRITGYLNVYVNDKKVASRYINYCPICGDKIDGLYTSPDFLKELKKYVDVDDPGTRKWHEAVRKVCETMNMDEWYERYDSLRWDEGDDFDAFLAERIVSQN